MKTATEVKRFTNGEFTGDARLYRVDPPATYEVYEGSAEVTRETSFVVVSATCAYSGPETYIFPATESGEIIDWSELEGSFRGGLDHKEALNGAGYEVPK